MFQSIPSQTEIDKILNDIHNGTVEQRLLEPLIWVEILITAAEVKMDEATGAVNHIWSMATQYGDDHPVTKQARQFAEQLNSEALRINAVARQLHEANKALLQQNPTFH